MLERELKNGARKLYELHRVREKEGISESTMKRARYALALRATESAPWYWALPEHPLPGEDGTMKDTEVL